MTKQPTKQRFLAIIEIDSTRTYTRDDLPDWIEAAMESDADESLAGIKALVFESADDLIADAWERNGMDAR